MTKQRLSQLVQEIRACEVCAFHLMVPPKPVVQFHQQAKILVIAQAPGTRARESGKPFDDKSGDRLRSWLGIDREIFYDETKLAFMPMGFCYPGKSATGDLPPCKECAPLWHPKILPHLTNVSLTLLVGTYAHRYYLKQGSVTTVMSDWRKHLPSTLPLPHPSWHNHNWLKRHPWFEEELVPTLQALVQSTLAAKIE
jgi:uracil-DNA glycosylase